MKSLVWAKLPRAGLGNKLLVWADAYIFAQKHHLPLVTTGWFTLHLGPILRGEKNKRLYINEINQTCQLKWVGFKIKSVFLKKTFQPPNQQVIKQNHLYIFNQYPHYSVWFQSIAHNIDLIRKGIDDLLHPTVKKELSTANLPFIAIHIRMGDFKRVSTEEEFNRTWVARTPLTYFRKVILLLREELGENTPVTLFSDGHPEELKELLSLPNVTQQRSHRDMTDIILMSKSKILITSQGSSFSYWASALNTHIVIHHFKDDIQTRHPVFNLKQFEGHLATDDQGNIVLPSLLHSNLTQLKSDNAQN